MQTNQERTDLLRRAAFIDKNSDLYQACPIFKGMVDQTVYLTDSQIHESMRVAGFAFYRPEPLVE
jgi:hypothetical protein